MDPSYFFGVFRLCPVRRELWAGGVPVAVGSRAFEVLLALVRRRGELATKNALMAEVWPGTAVEENNLTTHIAALRKILGDGEAARFILTVPGRGYRFVAPISLGSESAPPAAAVADPPPAAAGPAAAPAVAAAAPPPDRAVLHDNLPLALSCLVGREAETAEMAARLARHRLVTIVGAGGVGKTRLAIEAAAAARGRFEDGVTLIEFAPINEGALVAETVARQLNLSLPPGADAAKIIVSALKGARALLLFDNCEHLIGPISALAARLVEGCGAVVVLATSRERLRARSESCFQLLPLSPPVADGTEALLLNPAVRLFLDRAAAAVEGFTLLPTNAAAIATICRRLDGIPLAIELAVPWLRILTPAKLADRLDDRFRVLTRGSRDAMPHHQTLSGLIGWSYELLNPCERAVLDSLAVFPASFSAEAAVAAVTPELCDETATLEALASLVDKSLVMVQAGGAEPRYRLLETTWAWALEKLGTAGRSTALARVAVHVAQVFEAAEQGWPTQSSLVWRQRYEPELEILRNVLTWAFGEGGDTALGVRIAATANWFWEELGLVAEKARWLAAAYGAVSEATPPGIVGRIILGLNFTGAFGAGPKCDPHLPVAIFRTLRDPLFLALALRQLAAITMRSGETAEAELWLAEAEALLRPLGRTKPLCGVLDIRSTARLFAGDPAGCRALLEQAIALAREMEYSRYLEVGNQNLAELAFDEGAVAEAVALLRETLDECLTSGNLRTLCWAQTNLAGYLLALGEVDEALRHAREGLRLSVAIEDGVITVCCIEHLALIAARRGEDALACRLAHFGTAGYASGRMVRGGVEASTRAMLDAWLASRGGFAPQASLGPPERVESLVEDALAMR